MKKVEYKIVEVVLPKEKNLEEKPLRVVVISDTHNDTDKLQHFLPPGSSEYNTTNLTCLGDILIHCGDFTERKDWFGQEKGFIPPSIAKVF